MPPKRGKRKDEESTPLLETRSEPVKPPSGLKKGLVEAGDPTVPPGQRWVFRSGKGGRGRPRAPDTREVKNNADPFPVTPEMELAAALAAEQAACVETGRVRAHTRALRAAAERRTERAIAVVALVEDELIAKAGEEDPPLVCVEPAVAEVPAPVRAAEPRVGFAHPPHMYKPPPPRPPVPPGPLYIEEARRALEDWWDPVESGPLATGYLERPVTAQQRVMAHRESGAKGLEGTLSNAIQPLDEDARYAALVDLSTNGYGVTTPFYFRTNVPAEEGARVFPFGSFPPCRNEDGTLNPDEVLAPPPGAHPVLRTAREVLLRRVVAMAVLMDVAIFDAGGCAKRWREVLYDFVRFGLPLPRIHVNSPTFGGASPFSDLIGAGAVCDCKYHTSHAEMQRLFPSVFMSTCSCLMQEDEGCIHRSDCGLAVAVDSRYYFPGADFWLTHLKSTIRGPRGGQLQPTNPYFVLGHEYRAPAGRCGSEDNPEMSWDQDYEMIYHVCVPEHGQLTSYAHIALGMLEPHHVDPFGQGFTHQVCGEFSPWGTLQAYGMWEVRPVHGTLVDYDGLARRQYSVEKGMDLRSDLQRRTMATSHGAELVVTGAGMNRAVLVPQGALATIMGLVHRQIKTDAYPREAANIVNGCCAMPASRASAGVYVLCEVAKLYSEALLAATSGHVRRQYFRDLAWKVLLTLWVVWATVWYLAPEAWMLPIWTPSLLLCGSWVMLWYYALPSAIPDVLDKNSMQFSTRVKLETIETAGHEARRALIGWLRSRRLDFWYATGYITAWLPNFLGMSLWLRRYLARQQLPLQHTPLSLFHHMERVRGWRIDIPQFFPTAKQSAGYATIAGGDDVLTGLRALASTVLDAAARLVGYSLTLEPLLTHLSKVGTPPQHGAFYSAYSVPVEQDGRLKFAQITKPGRFLARAGYCAKFLLDKYKLARLAAVARGYEGYATIPVIGALVQVWTMQAGGCTARLPARYRPDLRYRFLLSKDTVATAETYEWFANHYDVTVSELYDCEDVILGCPSRDHDIFHPVLAKMIRVDTEFEVADCPRRPSRYEYVASGMFEEFLRFFMYWTFGPAGGVLSILIGIAEAVIAAAWAPLVMHCVLAGMAWYAPPLALAAHAAWNASATRRGDYRLASADQERRCCLGNVEDLNVNLDVPNAARVLPAELDPTVSFEVRLGNTAYVDVQPTEDWTLEQHSEYMGRPVYNYKKKPRKNVSGYSPNNVRKIMLALPCRKKRYDNNGRVLVLGARRLGSVVCPDGTGKQGTSGVPTVQLNCVHNGMAAFLLRRGPRRPELHPAAYREFQRLLIAFMDPLRRVVAAADWQAWSMTERFEWWVSRPGVYTAAAQEQHRRVWDASFVCGTCHREAGQCSHFEKIELSTKPAVKNRGITGLSPLLSVLRGPTTQLVAKTITEWLTGTNYATMAHCKIPLGFHWAKGADAVTLGTQIQEHLEGFEWSIGTDACEYDKCHLLPALRAVDCVEDSMPPEYRTWLRRVRFRSRVYFPTDEGDIRMTYSYHAGILTGEPNVSMSNTLIRMCLDLWTQAARLE